MSVIKLKITNQNNKYFFEIIQKNICIAFIGGGIILQISDFFIIFICLYRYSRVYIHR